MELYAPGLENAFVRLDPLDQSHRDPFHSTGAVDAMWKWMPMISTGTNYKSYFDHTLAQAKIGQIVPFAILSPQTNELLGVAAYLEPNRTHRRVQIAHIWLVPEARGKGIFIATQAAMIERAIEWGARRIVWLADERNEVAISAFRKLGAVEEGLAREYQRMTDGHWADMLVFSMLRPEAKEALKRLSAYLDLRAAS